MTGVRPERGAGPQAYRGERLGLPAEGRGSLAPVGARLGAFAVDAVASAFVAGLFTVGRHGGSGGHLPGSWSLIPLALDYVLGILFAGRTLGMVPFGIRVVRVDRDVAVGPVRAVARTALLMLLVPALIWDRDNRGIHDRATETAVVRG